MKYKDNLIPTIVSNFVFAGYILSILLQYKFGSEIFRERYIIIGFLPLLLFLFVIPKEIKNYVIYFSALFFLGSILSAINKGYYSFLYLVYSLIHISIVIMLFKYKISEYIPLIIFYMFSLFFFYNSAILKNISDIFPESSRNAVSWIALLLCSLYYLLAIVNNNNSKNPIPLFVLVIICVFANGRSGIITSFLLLISHLIFNYPQKNNKRNQLIINLFLLSAFVFAIFYFSSVFDEKLQYLQNKKLENASRMMLVTSYLKSLDPINFITGIDLATIPIFKFYHSNPHNSYIQCHVRFGIMAFLYIGFLIFSMLKGLIFGELKFGACIFACLLLRISTDKLAFVDNVDFLLIFACILVNIGQNNISLLKRNK